MKQARDKIDNGTFEKFEKVLLQIMKRGMSMLCCL